MPSETTAEPWSGSSRPQVPKVLDEPSHVLPDDFAPAHLAASQGGGGYAALTVRLFVSYTGNGSVRDVSVTLDVPDCARCAAASFVVPSVHGSSATPHVLPVTFYVQTKCIPMSTTVSAVATYTTETGEPRTSRVSFALPLACVGRLVPAIKSSTFKLTVDTNKGPVPLRPLFEDMFSQPGVNEVVVGGGASVNTVLSFQYWARAPERASRVARLPERASLARPRPRASRASRAPPPERVSRGAPCARRAPLSLSRLVAPRAPVLRSRAGTRPDARAGRGHADRRDDPRLEERRALPHPELEPAPLWMITNEPTRLQEH